MATRLPLVGLCAALSIAVGCGGGNTGNTTGCVPGQTAACTCAGGKKSMRICGQSGAYGQCLCGDAAGTDGAAADGAATDGAAADDATIDGAAADGALSDASAGDAGEGRDAPAGGPDAALDSGDAGDGGSMDRAPDLVGDGAAADGGAADAGSSPYEGSGALAWVQRSKGNGADQAFGFAVTTSGALVVGGHFNGSNTFAADSAAPKSFVSKGQDLWLTRSGADGALTWARTAGTSVQSVVSAVGPAPGDDVYVGGTVYAYPNDQLVLGAGEANQTAFSGIGTYFARYRADGTLKWAKLQKNGGQPWRLLPTPDGGFYAAGSMGLAYATFGVGEPNETKLIPRTVPSGEPSFLARFAADGQLVWVRTLGGMDPDAALMSDGGVVVVGLFGGSAGVLQGGSAPDVSLTPDWLDLFVASYSSAGDLRWAKQVKGLPQTEPLATTVLASGDIVVSGSCEPEKDGTAQQGDAAHTQAIFGPGEAKETKITCADFDLFMARYTSAGALVWAKTIPTAYPEIRGLAPLGDGGFVMASHLQNGSQVVFDPGTPGSITVPRLSQYGNLVLSWHRPDGTARAARIIATGGGRVLGLSVLSDGAVVMAGAFSGTTIFGPLDAAKVSYTKTGGGYENIVGEDMFLARLLP